jgi:hypothetical protein
LVQVFLHKMSQGQNVHRSNCLGLSVLVELSL